MIWRTALHCTQFWLLLALVSGDITEDDKVTIVNLHNYYRSIASPSAANMQLLVWDDTLSQVALKYASQCIWVQNAKVLNIVGESMFMTLGPLVVTQAVSVWYNEYKNYDYFTQTCIDGQVCGDYTQLVWANSTLIGCAAYFCPDVPNFGVQNATILVCNYYPPGNIAEQLPYEQGSQCSSCPNGTSGCVNNTCETSNSKISILSVNLITLLNVTGNLPNSPYAGGSAGFLKPSAATLLLPGLAVVYMFYTPNGMNVISNAQVLP